MTISAVLHKCGAYVATAVITALLTFVGTSYVNFLQHNRSVIESDFGLFKSSSEEMLQALGVYADRARTGAAVDNESRVRFRNALLKLHSEAEAIAKRDPKVRDEYAEFAKSLLALRESADSFSGPLDAKRFVESTSNYIDAHSRFSAKVSERQREFIRYIF
jgi:hypothetical protein